MLSPSFIIESLAVNLQKREESPTPYPTITIGGGVGAPVWMRAAQQLHVPVCSGINRVIKYKILLVLAVLS